MQEALHIARLAALEGALLALLRSAGDPAYPNEVPDGINVRLDIDGIDIEYTRNQIAVAGEGL